MIGILSVLKRGKLNEIFESHSSDLQKYVNGKKGKKYASESHLIYSRIQSIQQLLLDFRFVIFFVGGNYTSAFERLTRHIDRYSIPKDLEKPESLKDFKSFFSHVFGAHLDAEYKDKLRHFTDIEIMRLDESLITLKTGAYFSSIVMSVSAVEGRLHSIVKKDKPKLYKNFGLERAPLGALFEEIRTNKKLDSIKKKLSEKYSHLINLCNQYRIFSAHPKKELMNYQDALSVFGLSISFLLEN
jgi:hypothetical protein